MKKVILIHGFKRSGKDTIADLIVDIVKEKGLKAEKVALADALKEILCDTLEITKEELDAIKEQNIELKYAYDENEVKKVMPGRGLLKNFGQSMKKFLGETIWSDIILHRIFLSDADYFIVPDVRFYEEEFEYLKNRLTRDFKDVITIKVKGGHQDKGFEKEFPDNEFDIVLDNTDKNPKQLLKFKKILEKVIE